MYLNPEASNGKILNINFFFTVALLHSFLQLAPTKYLFRLSNIRKNIRKSSLGSVPSVEGRCG
jgi:hypothetical protein